ncbi:NlpC/P60 family protein [Neobacillus novalis]|uniref:NlpC/P60 family protein n=1 Tax=Neobacillus novalis TaxID=220687 RepID=A0AA95MKC6_9BACI|nr:NlpC/P60 family protein [Neobacillus novalis]WHY85489.1 NlpC/P60 family protein [Neobacillus novalis]
MKKFILVLIAVFLLTGGSFGIVFEKNKVNAAPIIGPNQTADQIADAIIKTGVSLIGKATYSRTEYKATYPYKFSCATFIDFIFKQNGVDLATYNEDYMLKLGVPVNKEQLKKGDLFFFDVDKTDSNPADHIGIYMGSNKLLHMADPTQNIVISDMSAKPYYTENFVGARRVIPSYMPSSPLSAADKIVNMAYTLQGNVTISNNVNNPATKTFTNGGIVNYIYGQNGITLGTNNVSELVKKGTFVSRANLKKGDLVFFTNTIGSNTPNIVAIYGGNNKVIFTNPTQGIVSRVLFFPWYDTHYLTARHVIK